MMKIKVSKKNLPSEIQEDIIKRLPVKSLIQFRSVCKAWKSLIDSSRFTKHYSNQHQHLLIRYHYQRNFHVSDPNYVSIVDDDDTIPHNKVAVTPPALVTMFENKNPRIIGCSHGLLCLSYYYYEGSVGKYMVVLWNVSIRKAIGVVVSKPNNVGDKIYGTAIGFGVCRETTDPKIVKITHITNWDKAGSIPDTIARQVEVFTLSAGVWRDPYSIKLPRTSIQFWCLQVVVDGLCYWLATDRSIADDGFEGYNLIVSFHLTSEEFSEVKLPDSLVYHGSMDDLNISNMRESLVVLEQDTNENVCYVWSLGDGVSKSFTKLFTIYSPDATLLSVLEFTKSGEPVIEIMDNDADHPCDVPSLLAVYEPKSECISNLGINGTGLFYANYYVETLLLLDQPELTVYDNGRSFTAKWRV